MVLCPYIFLLTDPNIPPLKLQPTEVASTHWVPLRALLSPHLRDFEYVDLSERFAKQGGRPLRLFLRSMLGMMMFSAVRLIPSESLYCSSIEGFIPEQPANSHKTPLGLFMQFVNGSPARGVHPILLWGLTLGVMADLLNMLPPHTAVDLWEYPTFTKPDLRFIIRIFTHSLRKKNLQQLGSGNQTAIDSLTVAVVSPGATGKGQHETGIGGLGVGQYDGQIGLGNKSHAVGVMLEGYYERVQLAIAVFLGLRTVVGSAAIYVAIRWLKRRK